MVFCVLACGIVFGIIVYSIWYIKILHSGPKAQEKWIPETMVCRILVFMWSFGPFSFCVYACEHMSQSQGSFV